MKRVLVSITVIVLIIGACSPQAQATDLPSVIGQQTTQAGTALTPVQQAAVAALARNLALTADEIKLISTEAVEWPDGCLGISTEGVSCAQVVTPGFRVLLEVNGRQVEYRTNEDATLIRPATVALTWKREGGIAGFCDNLTIYLSGEVQGSSCNNAGVVEKRLTDLLAAKEIATMNEWISRYGVVEIDASDPKGVSDAMTVQLKLIGTGTEQMKSAAVQQILLQFVQQLNQKLYEQ